MKKFMFIMLVAFLSAVLVACESGSGETTGDETEAIGQEEEAAVDVDRVRMLIGSTATGGDTYQIADALSRHAEDVMETNMQVDAVGSLRAFDELGKAEDDGSTIMFFHDMSYLGVEYGSFGEEAELENWTIGPIVATNPGNAFLTNADAPYDTMVESAEWLSENPDETITVAVESGGVSQIGFDGFYLWVEEEFGTDVSDRIHAYVTGSQEDKNQALWDGNADIIHGSIGANEQYTQDEVEDRIKMKFLGITAGERMEEIEIPTFAEQGVTVNGDEFIFDKEFFLLMPEDIDESYVQAVDNAVEQVVEDPSYEEDLVTNRYTVNHMSAAEAEEYLLDKRDNFRYIIENAPNLDDIAR
ncbi:tripartite-type tricarboxylate transporter receptor subunit TctC [Geomicrobium halophilum]|uniref:Tripartite-type tricarboxylate transporter receptor subunit TctC n=1 Tax=Geomicrobium halophilum TaxID=549000 RepID=A0A841PZ13_9BACL|nr:tripartite tricarboxylate transporter substrate-binding protein [Geomicrobium halophilum]MBB6450043.1 tripartite-type tricarboxylate transporter receptor subunit TctC [Geomicrobium halophilum]